MNKNRAGNPGGTERLLWMTDTYGDHNGVSTALQAVHREITAMNLPIDLMVCSSTLPSDDHLVVVKPVSEFTLPFYRQQHIRIPNYREVQRIFKKGGYSRILCSTEGPMGFAALWLKRVFSAEVSFFLHTDWLVFAKEALRLEPAGVRRLQRLLQIYYARFDKIFVLNTDHHRWLTGEKMRFDPARVFFTAHWPDPIFSNLLQSSGMEVPFDRKKPVVLYAGRLSREKGVTEIPAIIRMVRSIFPEVQLVIAGTGPAEEALRQEMPDAFYLGWVEQESLPGLYLACDLLLLPSRFDTFSCVVIEAMCCGLPVVAYNTKGPKDIVQDSVNGFLVETGEEMAGVVIRYYLDPERRIEMKQEAFRRADSYRADTILNRLLLDTGIIGETMTSR